MENKTLVLVVGADGAGASSLVRAVRGPVVGPERDPHRTVDGSTGRSFWTHTRTLQEANISEDRLRAHLLDVALDDGPAGLVLASLPTGDGHLSLDRLVEIGREHFYVKVVLLDPPISGDRNYFAATREMLPTLGVVQIRRLNPRRDAASNAPEVLRLLFHE